MAHYKTFWDLESSQAYTTHTVERFDNNTETGGGVFRWILSNNTSVANVPGFRIKPTSTTLGYWERIVDGDTWSVDWFGCINTSTQGTLASYGFTTTTVNARWNTITGSNTVTTADTYDTAAIKLAFNLMEQKYMYSISFSRKSYYLTSTCFLPLRTNISTTDREYALFVITGNAAQMEVHSTVAATAFDMWSRNITTNTQANSEVNTAFNIDNLSFRGVGSLQKGIHLKATYNSIIDSCNFTNLSSGLHLRFCLGTRVTNCIVQKIAAVGINVDCGDSSIYAGGWTGGSYGSSNSQSNSTEVYKCRFWNGHTPAAVAVAINGCSGIELNQCIFEGTTGTSDRPWNYAVLFHARGSGNVKDFTVHRSHLECKYNTSAIYLNLSGGGKATVDGIYSQYDNTLVHVDDNLTNSKVTISNIESVTSNTVFRDDRIGSGGSGESSTFWYFDRVMSIDPADPSNWFTGALPGGVVSVIQAAGSSPSNRAYIFRPFSSAS